MELVGEGDDWDEHELTRWLDAELHRGGSFQGLALAESQPWLRRVVAGLVSGRGMQLPFVVRRRHSLAEVLRVKVADHGRRQVRDAMNLLIREEPVVINFTKNNRMDKIGMAFALLYSRGTICAKMADASGSLAI